MTKSYNIQPSATELVKILSTHASKDGKDQIVVWNDWLRWCCYSLEWNNVRKYGDYTELFKHMREDNADYFNAMQLWIEYATDRIKSDGVCDSFGEIYEAYYRTGYKASNTGQFFTPMPLCLLCAEIDASVLKVPTDRVLIVHDPACGSSRLPLAAWKIADKSNRILFIVGDLDATSVYMSALNFFVSGIVGAVEKRNALSMEWFEGWIVNAGKVPYYNDGATLQHYTNEAEYDKALCSLEYLAKDWDIIKSRPAPVPKEVITYGEGEDEIHVKLFY